MNRILPCILALGLGVMLAACGSDSSSHSVAAAHSPLPSPSSYSPDTGTTDGSLLACGTVVDSNPSDVGLKGSNLTTQNMIAYLEVMALTDAARIITGAPSASATTIIEAAIIDLQNYNGGQLASDAGQLVQDAENYSGYPDNNNVVDTSYAKALTDDITTLAKDCPGAGKEVAKLLKGGSS